MLDVCLLGTGGMMPLPNRWLTSLLLRFNGSMILVDCGEGTQITLKQVGWGFKSIDAICFTHYHADHISGLPGMLLSLGNFDRKEPLKLIGPPSLKTIVESLRIIAPNLPYEIEYIHLNPADLNPIVVNDFIINACAGDHELPCLAYSFETKRTGKFNPQMAINLKIPKHLWGILQKGESLTIGNNIISPDFVMGEQRSGFKVSYCTDSRPTNNISSLIKGSDLFVCEGMYGDDEKKDKAISKKHMIFSEAAELAKTAGVDELWLTHFSPAMSNPEDYIQSAKNIFDNVKVGYDRIKTTLTYSD